ELHDRLGRALAARRRAQPGPALDEGERVADATLETARAVFVTMVAPKLDAGTLAAGKQKLDGAVAALDARLTAQPDDVWAKIMLVPLDVFRREISATSLSPAHRLQSESVHEMVGDFVWLLEARMRAFAHIERRRKTP